MIKFLLAAMGMSARGILMAGQEPNPSGAASGSGGDCSREIFIEVEVEAAGVVFEVNERYASWNVDSSWDRGFFHIEFSNKNLVAAARALRPSTLRFGGSGNDYLLYNMPSNPDVCMSGHDSPRFGCMNATHWDKLYNLAEATETDFLFGVSFDKISAGVQGKGYRWNSSNAQDMMQYIVDSNQTIWGFELGNEVNNLGAKGSNITGADQAAAFVELAEVIEKFFPNQDTRPMIVGPDSGYYSPQPWLKGFLGNLSSHLSLYAVTHHVYPGVDTTNYNLPSTLDRIHDDIGWYPPIIDSLMPSSQVWAGENGPTGGGSDGTCGDNSACGTYATTLWYADELGLRARSGFSQHQRQDLLGGRYGLLGIDHDNEALGAHSHVAIHPDFWINFMWKRVMGAKVLNVTVANTNAEVRVYAHCGMPPSPNRIDSELGLVVINLSNTTESSIGVPGATALTGWSLTPGRDGVFGSKIDMNGVELLDLIQEPGQVPEDVPVAGVMKKIWSLPPVSVNFISVSGIRMPPGCAA
uniref:Beta-glucuronidase C-terminal domain-containing protein n=2 Tax=Lotharella globosa TaxID=91324 RepID=A0A7S3YZQ8_9EUKA|eukprot:CAMPEP_0167782894 /NCGR_PEP_ID=MMETSP0111_2-20121227/6774_1 /TAXON_ID=91324 /ORGANISM="Lotharella globosa, Strain CCCM811" /LENGTH=524 /DNA_ID=CAMNT_0007673783 /DNA_START=15 /DNA_END=1589 /DNA_ORIENTATION=+